MKNREIKNLQPLLKALDHIRRARALADAQFKTDLHDHLAAAEKILESIAQGLWKNAPSRTSEPARDANHNSD